jgi:hypothetical protein
MTESESYQKLRPFAPPIGAFSDPSGGSRLCFPMTGMILALSCELRGLPWLSFSCSACGQWGSLDLRTLDRHPSASISSLIPSVSCRRCSPHAPFAKLETLTAERP